MTNYDDKSREELLAIIEKLEKENKELSSLSAASDTNLFRRKYSSEILESLPDMLTVFNHNGDVEALVSSEETNHVSTLDSSLKKAVNIKDLLDEEQYNNVNNNLQHVLQTGKPSTAHHNLVFQGSMHYYENRLFPLDENYILCMCRDITPQRTAEMLNEEQRKQLEVALRRAEESDKLKSSFLANMSHEIRTPLNAIVGFSKLIAYAENPEEKVKYGDIVEKNSEILLRLFNDILDVAAIEAGSVEFKHQPVRVFELCRQQALLFKDKMQPFVRFVFDDGLDKDLCVMGDMTRIAQIINNLLSNAVKFTTKGEVHFGYEKKGDFVELYVRDTGIGISPDEVATIFRRFGKLNDFVQGSGLGLTLCRLLVGHMGGKIWVESKEGEGSCFYFTLPLVK